jgi:hypothetical protein
MPLLYAGSNGCAAGPRGSAAPRLKPGCEAPVGAVDAPRRLRSVTLGLDSDDTRAERAAGAQRATRTEVEHRHSAREMAGAERPVGP